MKIEETECFETSAYKIQTPRNYPEEIIQDPALIGVFCIWTLYDQNQEKHLCELYRLVIYLNWRKSSVRVKPGAVIQRELVFFPSVENGWISQENS
jgi:hypothetical protein